MFIGRLRSHNNKYMSNFTNIRVIENCLKSQRSLAVDLLSDKASHDMEASDRKAVFPKLNSNQLDLTANSKIEFHVSAPESDCTDCC